MTNYPISILKYSTWWGKPHFNKHCFVLLSLKTQLLILTSPSSTFFFYKLWHYTYHYLACGNNVVSFVLWVVRSQHWVSEWLPPWMPPYPQSLSPKPQLRDSARLAGYWDLESVSSSPMLEACMYVPWCLTYMIAGDLSSSSCLHSKSFTVSSASDLWFMESTQE